MAGLLVQQANVHSEEGVEVNIVISCLLSRSQYSTKD